MKNLLYRMFDYRSLDRDEARRILIRIASGEYNDSQIAALITVFLMRSITLEELSGFRDALLELRIPVDLSDYDTIDIVGTGGDNKNTFNISTAACFTVAGAGYKVVKHGNYGATSVSGASNVMEQHGVKFTAGADRIRRSLDECNIAYLHAQLFNPALKAVGPVRKALGVRTFFNMLGPLVNPAVPRRQMLGVYNLKLGRLYNYMYQQGDVHYTIVNSLDGYDEISLTSEFKCLDNHGESIYSPEELGFRRAAQEELSGGDTVADAALIFGRVLAGEGTAAQTDAVVANAAFAIRSFEPDMCIGQCIEKARESITGGGAMRAFRKFVELNS